MCCQGQQSQELGHELHLGLPPWFNVFCVFILITVWMVFFVSFFFPSLNDDTQISRVFKKKKEGNTTSPVINEIN